jgi:autotransporter adhesin
MGTGPDGITSYTTLDSMVANGRGPASEGNGYYSTVIGCSAQGNSLLGVTVYGSFAAATGDGAVALGFGSRAARWATASGLQARATGESSLAAGFDAAAGGIDAVALGHGANADQAGSVALGSGAVTAFQHVGDGTPTAFAIDGRPVAGRIGGAPVVSVGAPGAERQIQNLAPGVVDGSSTDAVNGSQLYATNQAIGAVANIVDSITVGAGIKYFRVNSSLGEGLVSGVDSILIGPAANAYGDGSIAQGVNAVAGVSNDAAVANGIAIGNGAKALGANAIAQGLGAMADTGDAVAIGTAAVATGGRAVSIGTENEADGDGAVAVGDPNKANGPGAVAVGRDNTAKGRGAVAIGDVNVAEGQGAVAVGSDSRAYGDGAAAIGDSAVADKQGAFALGSGAIAGYADGDVALGAGSITSASSGSTGITLGGNDYFFAGTSPTSTVSVGAAGRERTVTHLAAGALSRDSTEAVNGSQLYATNQQVDRNAGDIVQLNNQSAADAGDIATLQQDALQWNAGAGAYDASHGTASPQKIINVGSALLSPDSTEAVNGSQLYATDQQVNQNTTAIAQLADASSANAGGIVTLRQDALLWDEGKHAYDAGHGTASPQKITQLAEGEVAAASTDAVNGAQLFSTLQAIGSVGTRLDDLGRSMASGLGGGSAYDPATGAVVASFSYGGDTYHSVQDVFNRIGYAIGSGVKYFNVASSAPDSTAIGVDSVAIGPASSAFGEASIAMGANAVAGVDGDSSVIDGMALGHGAQATASHAIAQGTDAVADAAGAMAIGRSATATGGKAVAIGMGNVATGDGAVAIGAPNVSTGQGAVALGADNSAVGQGALALGNQNTATGRGAVALGNAATASGDGTVALGDTADAAAPGGVAVGTGARAEAADSVAIGSASVAERAGSVSVGAAGSERQITHVAAGTAATDAVNLGQLRAAQAGGVTYDTTASGEPDYDNITLNAGGSATVIHNVGTGTAATDAANVGQLSDAISQAKDWSRSYTDQRFQTVDENLNRLGRRANAATASAMAMATLPQAYQPDQNAAGVAIGSFHGETGIAVGVSTITESGRYIFKLNASTNTRGDTGLGMGAGMVW